MAKKAGKKRQARRTARMAVIPEPAPNTRSVIIYTGPGTVAMKGGANVTMVCGNCGSPILEGIKTSQVQSLVFRCNNCQAFNETPI
jgi:predicted RNA-binding Zn-ribbon protein involved in translation (DUF1610 family)